MKILSTYKKTYKIFDAHTHAFPSKLAARAVGSISEKAAGIPYRHDGSFAGLCEYEKQGGSCGFLLLTIATKPSQTYAANTWVAKKTGNGVYAFGSVHPDSENLEDELDYIVSLKLKGVKLHPEYQEFYPDEEKMFPFYNAIFDRGLMIYFHAGADLGYPPPIKGEAKRIARVCEAFPNNTVIAAHMGGFLQGGEVKKHLAGRENVWFDTSFAAECMKSREIAELTRLHGVKRVMFGTDAPWTKFENTKNALLESGLNDEELADVFYNNAARLLGL